MTTAPPSSRSGSIARFVLVGTLAAAVHWGVVVALVERVALAPLAANVAGWLTALGVSFAGHHRWTFRGHGERGGAAFVRFAAVSAGGFALNELAYAATLRWSARRYDVALALVLVGVAGATFLLSRHWVFAGRRR